MMKFQGRIIISFNGTIITPYKKGQCKQLEYNTSIWDEVYHRRTEITGFITTYEGESAFFTHSNNPTYLQEYFPLYEISYMRIIPPKLMTDDYQLKQSITPTDLQYDLVNEIMTDIEKNRMKQQEWFINLQTGFGKTLLSVYLASLLKYKTLITCFSTEILKQWLATIEKHTTFNPARVLLIDSSKILLAIYEGRFDLTLYDIYMCTPGLLTDFTNKHGTEKLQIIFHLIGIGLKIFDEAHRNKSNIVKINAMTNVKYTLYLSADYSQANPTVQKMYYNIFRKCKILTPDEKYKVDMRYTKAVVVEYNTNPNELDKASIYNRYGFSAQYYMDYEFRAKKIFEVVQYLLDTIRKVNTEYKILILLNYIDHVDKLYDILNDKYGDVMNVGKFHSKLEKDYKDNVRVNSNLIISTYSSFGTGMDVDAIKYVISLNQCNKIEDNQAAGRARPMKDGSPVFYFMLVDKGFSYCTKKLSGRVNYLKETKISEVTKLKY